LYVFVYLFLIAAGLGLWFELKLNEKRELLTDRNRMQEDYLIKIAATIEKDEPNKAVTAEIEKDVSPVEAKIIDVPEKENVLEDYKFYLEQQSLPTFSWDNQGTREQLRRVWDIDPETGKPAMDGTQKLKDFKGSELELLKLLFEGCQAQQAKLNTTRGELAILHGKLESVVEELNRLKPEARQDKVTIVEKNEKIAKLEEEKAELENQIVKIKAQIDELNAEITSLKDEVVTAHDETAAVKEDLEKAQKLNEQLKKHLKEALAQLAGVQNKNLGSAAGTLPAGDKGKIVEVDNVNMFAIVEMTPEAMKQLKGDDPSHPIPAMEFGVKRPGFAGPAGEFVGRIRLRQEVAGKNYVVCDILGNWEQDKLAVRDVVFAE
jgi:hypothetical protein